MKRKCRKLEKGMKKSNVKKEKEKNEDSMNYF